LLNSSTLFASKKFAQCSVTETTWVDIRCLDRTPPGGSQPLYAVIGHSFGAGRLRSGD
jgi:hypothetical protein